MVLTSPEESSPRMSSDRDPGYTEVVDHITNESYSTNQPTETCKFLTQEEQEGQDGSLDSRLSGSGSGDLELPVCPDTDKDNHTVSKDLGQSQNPSHGSLKEDPPDGGYGWVIVVCCLLVMTTYGSNWVMFSIYNTDFSETFGRPQAQIGIIGSVDAAFSQITALPSGAFVSLYGCRPVCIVGLLIYGIGTFLSAFTSNFYMLVLTFGVIKGSGVGMIYVPSSMLVQQYFTRNRALAAGISSSGLSLGTMLFGPIHRLLISSYGWRGGLIISSGIIFQMLVCAAMMRPLRQSRPQTNTGQNNAVSSNCHTEQGCANSWGTKMRQIWGHLRRALTISVFRDPRFPLFLSMRSLAMFGVLAMYKFSVARAVDFQIDKLLAAFLVTSIGIASSVFRYIGGLIGNLQGVNRLLMYSLSTSFGGLVAILSICATTTFAWHMIFHLVYGAFLGLAECLLPTVATDLFTISRLPVTLGWIMLVSGTISLLCMPLFGLIFDVTGSFSISYIFGGIMQIVGACAGFCILIYQRKHHSGSTTDQLSHEVTAVDSQVIKSSANHTESA